MGHHLILGELTDYLTGETLADTLDERYRQGIARLLVEEKGFSAHEIVARRKLQVRAGDQCAIVPVDFLVNLADRTCMIIRYGPGSIVTRHRPSLAVARIVAPYQVPVVVVTNGKDADVLDGVTGRSLAEGLSGIPDRAELEKIAEGFAFHPILPERAEREARIVYAFDVDGACPCDDTVCRLGGEEAGKPGS
jgi:hypothetical protein